MASATFCNFQTITAVIKIRYKNFIFLDKSIYIYIYILRTRTSEAIERVLKWIVFTLYSIIILLLVLHLTFISLEIVFKYFKMRFNTLILEKVNPPPPSVASLLRMGHRSPTVPLPNAWPTVRHCWFMNDCNWGIAHSSRSRRLGGPRRPLCALMKFD